MLQSLCDCLLPPIRCLCPVLLLLLRLVLLFTYGIPETIIVFLAISKPHIDHFLKFIALGFALLAAIVYGVRRYRLTEPEGRKLFLEHGRLARSAMGPPPGTC